MRPKPIDFDTVVAMKQLSLQRELETLEEKLKELSGWRWQVEYDLYKALRKFRVLGHEGYGSLYAEPPHMRPRHPIIPGTAADWNFQSAAWVLDTVTYRSAPSSLRANWDVANQVVCNYPGTTNLPVGRIESWWYKDGSGYSREYGFCCRLQYPTWADRYYVRHIVVDGVGTTYCYFYEGVSLLRSVLIPEPPINAWFRYRLTWWTSGGWFILRFERWDGAAWQNDAGDELDMTPSWGSPPTNRCGLYILSHATTQRVRADDTVIYGP